MTKRSIIIRRFFPLILAVALCLSLCVTEAGAAFSVGRDDGTWLFPCAKTYYNKFTDWAGCPGTDKCPICGAKHKDWGDSIHTGQGGHNGIDIGAPKGADVLASAPGTVRLADTKGSSARGKYIIIEHTYNDKYSYYSYYQHLSKTNVQKGDSVAAGAKIGAVGNTGGKYGYHLHFGIVMGKKDTNIQKRLAEIENKGWVLTKDREGKILNNPSAKSAVPTGNKEVVPPLKYHKGSTTYTFKKNEVKTGSASDNAQNDKSSTDKAQQANDNSSLRIGSGHYNPGTLKRGSYYSIDGTVSSGSKLTSVTVGIYKSDGSATSYVRTAKPNSKSYNIKDKDYDMMFNRLSKGTYYFKVTAKDASGASKTLVNNRFTVK